MQQYNTGNVKNCFIIEERTKMGKGTNNDLVRTACCSPIYSQMSRYDSGTPIVKWQGLYEIG